jgi:hypothetical protein
MDSRDAENCRCFLSYIYLDYPWLTDSHKSEIVNMVEQANANMKVLVDNKIDDREDSNVKAMYKMWHNLEEKLKMYKNVYLSIRVSEYEKKILDLETFMLPKVDPTVIPKVKELISVARGSAKHSTNSNGDSDARFFSGIMSKNYDEAHELCILSQLDPLFPVNSNKEAKSLSELEVLTQKLCEIISKSKNGAEICVKKENDQISYTIIESKGVDHHTVIKSVSRKC